MKNFTLLLLGAFLFSGVASAQQRFARTDSKVEKLQTKSVFAKDRKSITDAKKFPLTRSENAILKPQVEAMYIYDEGEWLPFEDLHYKYDLKGNIVRLDDGTVLEYLPWKVELDISNTPYEQTAGARMKKYEVDETATKDGKLMENDIVLFRYADVLLMKSEAKVRNGEDGDAELNEVRGRVNASSRTATLENILAERQLELAWEGWRRQDLIRFGAFTRAYSSRPQLPAENNGYTTVFPIPEKIRVMNTKLEQNPGY